MEGTLASVDFDLSWCTKTQVDEAIGVIDFHLDNWLQCLNSLIDYLGNGIL